MEHQQVLYLWTSGSALDSGTVGWAFHDGTAGSGPCCPTHHRRTTGVAALRDGWMLLQSSQLTPPPPGEEHLNNYLEYEFVFERRVTT